MALIDYPDRESISPRAREVLEEWEDEHGSRSLILESLALHDPTMAAFIGFFDHAMRGGSLDRRLKELVAVVVSEENDCDYCAESHGETLTAVLGEPPDLLETIADGRYGDLPEPDRTVAAFAVQATRDPLRVDAEDLEALRALGFDDEDVVELLGVVCCFQAANTYTDALNVLPADLEG